MATSQHPPEFVEEKNTIIEKKTSKSLCKPSLLITAKRIEKGTGIDMDIQVLKDIYGTDYQIDTMEFEGLIGPKFQRRKNYAAVFFLEHIPQKIPNLGNCKKIWIINQEFIYDYDLQASSCIDLVWCKTRHGLNVANKIKELQGKAQFIGFYTKLPMHTKDDIPFDKKDKRLAVHFAGNSSLKNTYDVIECWLSLPKEVDINLFVSFTDSKVANMTEKNLVFQLIYSLDMHRVTHCMGIRVDAWRYKNLDFADHVVNDATYWALCKKTAYHIMPSKVEEFGHSINIGRLVGSVVVTTNAAPMNEMITKDMGFLADVTRTTPVQRSIISWIPPCVQEVTSHVSSSSLQKSVLELAGTDVEHLLKMAEISKKNALDEEAMCKDFSSCIIAIICVACSFDLQF